MDQNLSEATTSIKPNIVYEKFKDSGVTPALVALIGCKALVCLVGVLLNMDMVYITWRTKSLRGACNLQIALNALSISIQECSTFVTFLVVVTGTNFIPLRICGIIQFLPLFCTIFTNGIAFSIGIDRLISVLFPLWHLANNYNRSYFSPIIIFCSIYAAIVPIVGLKISLDNPTVPVMCTVIDPVQREATWVVIMLLLVNLASVCCYILVWIIVKWRKNMKRKQVHIFKSLTLIVVLELFGWVTNYAMRLLVDAANINELDIWYLVNISTIVPYISMSLSPLVLYIFSGEYGSCFKRQFPAPISSKLGLVILSINTSSSLQSQSPRKLPNVHPKATQNNDKSISGRSANESDPSIQL